MFITALAILSISGLVILCTYRILEPRLLRQKMLVEMVTTRLAESTETPMAVAAVSLPPPEELTESVEPAPQEPTRKENELTETAPRSDTSGLSKIEAFAAAGRLQAAYRKANALPGAPSSSMRAKAWSVIVRRGVNVNRAQITWAIHGLTLELTSCNSYDLLPAVYFLALDTAEFCGDRNVPCPRLRAALRNLYPRLSPLLQGEAAARLESQTG